jgi:ATP-binding cassette, subfamily C, bacterial
MRRTRQAGMNDLRHQNQTPTGTRPELSSFSTAKSFLSSFIGYAGKKAWISLTMMVLLGLTEGAGLIMLIPLLRLIGIDEGGQPDRMSLLVGAFFDMIGLPLSLKSILCAYIAIVGTHALASRYQDVLNARLSLGYTQFMQDLLYKAFARADWLCLTRIRTANVVRVLTNDLIRVGYSTGKLLELIALVLLTLIYIGVVLSISCVMSLFVIASIAVILLCLHPYNRQAHSSGEVYQTAVENMYLVASEHLSGMKIAKGYGLESEHTKSFSGITEQVATQGIRFVKVDATTLMFHRIGAAAALSAFFYIGAEFIRLPSSSLLLAVFVFARLSPQASLVQHYTQFVINSLPAYREATLILSSFEMSHESPRPSLVRPLRLRSSIRLTQVSFAYDGNGDGHALSQIDLAIRARSTVAVVGPSGSGKTTLADLIMGLLTPTEGKIFIDGRPLIDEALHNWRSAIGYVPQETFLFHDTIRNNLLLVKPCAEEREIWDVLRHAAADTFVTALPDGLDTLVGDRGIRLSGGERQRIALARALLRNPTVLILDEATSSLDTTNERKIQEAIEGLHGALTMVVIAHRLSTIRRADSIVVLEQGQIVETGTWESLSQKEGGRFWALLEQTN